MWDPGLEVQGLEISGSKVVMARSDTGSCSSNVDPS